MNSAAADVMREAGLPPEGDDVKPRVAELLEGMVSDFDGESALVEAVDLAVSEIRMDDEPDDAWVFPDGSILLRFGATWMATDTEGVDADGSLWFAA